MLTLTSCDEGDDNPDEGGGSETDYTDLLTNQVNEVIIPTMETYQEKSRNFVTATTGFASSIDEANLSTLRTAYQEAYLAYQAVAVHNFYATANQNLVNTTNLYPVDTSLLSSFIASESYNFNTDAQKRANGFPALDFMLYGTTDVVAYFQEDSKRVAFLQALVTDMKTKSEALVTSWTGTLKNNFIGNGGTALGSSISVQLNDGLVYYEDHIRENKVGIPIGRLGPNDTPIPADPTKIEAYYQSQFEGNENFTLSLVQTAIEEMEDVYLGDSAGTDQQGYDDLLIARNQPSIDNDIKAQFTAIYAEIAKRTSISGDESLYNEVQRLVSLYKSDLMPTLNVQDADGANDGD